MTHEPTEVRRARQWSKFFVIGLVAIFVFLAAQAELEDEEGIYL